ncbi:MAG: hypothetical protein L3J57_08295 [Desulfuromusa sp.]|nr:hypothetical protein [Desulfuromusa sp.]
MMKLTVSLAKKLLCLIQGESLPRSQLKYAVVERMVEEGVLAIRSKGSRQTVYCRDATRVQSYLVNHFGIGNLARFIAAAAQTDLQRSEAVRVASDSKFKSIRSFKGFLVNCYHPLMARMGGFPVEISPRTGMFTYVHDFDDFVPAADIIVVGVENGENFRYIERQQELFPFAKILFVSRYPQSGDLLRWLQGIPNRYVHFGDFDFAGINIYLHEFKQYLDTRAEFFMPEGIEKLFQIYGNRDLYQRQIGCAPERSSLPEPGLKLLWDLICVEKKGVEQEVLISAAAT